MRSTADASTGDLTNGAEKILVRYSKSSDFSGERYNLSTFVTRNGTTNDCFSEWVEKTVPESTFLSGKKLQLGKLRPLFTSVSILPDATMVNNGVPVVALEVDSGNYKKTIRKMSLVLLDHFRWLRNEQDLLNLSGFVFPNFETKQWVTKVTITWDINRLIFSLSYHTCPKEEVEEALWNVYKLQRHLQKPVQVLFGFPLGKAALEKLDGTLQVGTFSQMESSTSILLFDGNKVWKSILNDSEARTIQSMILRCGWGKSEDKPYLLPHSLERMGYLDFFVYTKLGDPLTKEEAKTCLYEFMREVSEAIKSLHTTTGYAHLDIRLENICFRVNKPVLIDLDRAMDVTMKLATLYSGSVMYNNMEDYTADRVDWRQFGIMIVYCRKTTYVKDYHSMDVDCEGDMFVSGLLQGRKPDCDCGPEEKEGERKSLLDVIQDRSQ